GGVALRLEHASDGLFLLGDANARRWPQRSQDANAVGVASRQKGCPRGGADRLGDMEVGEAHALAVDAVQVGRLPSCSPIAAEVVGVDEDEIRSSRGRIGGQREQAGENAWVHGGASGSRKRKRKNSFTISVRTSTRSTLNALTASPSPSGPLGAGCRGCVFR